MSVPALNLYNKFGDPNKLVEFRIFSFNTCSAGCKNCFYRKTDNNYASFDLVKKLAHELKEKSYSLETCYLLPTDVFESEFNYKIFEDSELQETLRLFNYVGFASTLRNGFDELFLTKMLSDYPHLKIEMHVNLLEELIDDEFYRQDLTETIRSLKAIYGSRILINLALNTGTVFKASELESIRKMVEQLSDDKILELNFTFLFNQKLTQLKKTHLLQESFPIMHYFSDHFAKNEQAFNSRTLLRKPSFVFKDSKIFLSPIIPFDEYVFIESEDFRLKDADFSSFLEAYARIDMQNLPLWDQCLSCEQLPICQGKSYFSLAKYFNLPCIKERESHDSSKFTGR